MNVFEELKWRGLIDNITSPEIEDALNSGGLTFYIGTDPTGDSLHIGHYSSLLVAKRLKDAGHHPLMLVGGATGFIGDPRASGERSMLSAEQLSYNYNALAQQVQQLFGFEMVNNLDWTKDLSIIDFLRDFGKHFNINYMLSKDTVKSRLETGISYTEFSYMILQAMDYLHLYETKGCTLQIGGQDQWGNITSGLELIRKVHGVETKCFGLTMPLITKADGTKFGKSESGESIWLDINKTSAYQMYQFLVNSDDLKVIDYLKKLTFLSVDEIEDLANKVETEPFKREAQRVLAREVITYLHGEDAFLSAQRISQALFSGDVLSLSKEEQRSALTSFDIIKTAANQSLLELVVSSGIASSNREGREWIKQGSIQLNGVKLNDPEMIISKEYELVDQLSLVKRGKRNFYVVSFE